MVKIIGDAKGRGGARGRYSTPRNGPTPEKTKGPLMFCTAGGRPKKYIRRKTLDSFRDKTFSKTFFL